MNAKSLSFEWLRRGTGGGLGRGRHGPGSPQRGRAGESDRALAIAVVEDADDTNNGPPPASGRRPTPHRGQSLP
jgi:hypothetical protein